MKIKKFKQHVCYLLSLFYVLPAFAQSSPLGQTLQIHTNFRTIAETPLPTWTLIIRDVNTGVVTPYMFDIREHDNFWIAFTYGHAYRVTASRLKFGNCNVISNFCNLEKGVIDRHSFWIHITGDLDPTLKTLKCRAIKHKDMAFNIAEPNSA